MSVNHRDLDLGFFQRIIMRKVRLFGLKKHLVKMPNRYKFLYYYSLVEENPKNRTRMKLSEKEMIREIAEAAAAKGGRAYFVGGCVRDALLGKKSKDTDIEVHGVEPAAMESILEEMSM